MSAKSGPCRRFLTYRQSGSREQSRLYVGNGLPGKELTCGWTDVNGVSGGAQVPRPSCRTLLNDGAGAYSNFSPIFSKRFLSCRLA